MTAAQCPEHVLQLAEVLDVTAAGPLAHALLSLRCTDVVIDASRVERIGAQCLQTLLSAQATWRADGVKLNFVNPSPGFAEGLQRLGISPTMLLKDVH